MHALELYARLEQDFIKSGLSDDWALHMEAVAEFLCDNFKQRSMGLVCDFANEVNKVYTAVFPAAPVMQRIIDDGASNAMLFVHHPSIWDIRRAPEVFQQMDKSLLEQFRGRNISIYNLHVPLDNFGEYSTSVSLAKALDINPDKPFAPYFGAMAGVFGRTDLSAVQDMRHAFQAVVGHQVGLYEYGDSRIIDGRVAIVAGGGNSADVLTEVAAAGINTFITGITANNDHSRAAHEYARQYRINILGGTHYSTEQFACIAMVDYFKQLGLPSEFIADQPVMEDL